MPSDTGAALGESLSARYTVTFTAPKWSHVFPPNSERVGELFVTPIGTPPSAYENDPSIYMNLITQEDFAWVGAKRPPDTHKGTYGHALIVAGSRGKSGAAALAGLGALRAGAGLVTVATASSVWTSVAAASPALMTEPLAETEDGAISLGAFDYGRFESIAAEKSVIAIGPGVSTNPSTVAFTRRVIKESAHIPVVLDADGLNAFAGATDLLDGKGRTLILTPHPGEMSRLAGVNTKQVQENRVDVAREFAGRHKLYLILKGYRTLVAAPNGQVYVNPTGNPGMATAGTGDVLTGIIAGLLAQHPGVAVEKVLSAAVYWHGAAGDAAAANVGEVPLIATDLLGAMPEALRAACAASKSEGGVA
jgi:NAD(P)H-hydrate epimerase